MVDPHVQAAVKGLIVKDGKFLTVQQKVSGRVWWDIPGGRIKYGEDPRECLVREIFEETGLNVEILKPIGVWHFFRFDNSQVVCFTFLCDIKSGELNFENNPDEEEIFAKYGWYTPEEFLKKLEEAEVPHESFKKIIFDYFNRR